MNAVIASLRSELMRLWRIRPVAIAMSVAAIFAVGSTLLVLDATASSTAADRGGLNTTALAAPGGGTQVFRTAIAFAGFFVFVVVVGVISAEFSRGTVRTMLLRQPHRLSLLTGKVGAIVLSGAALLAGVEALSWTTAMLFGPSEGIDTSAWTSFTAVGEGLLDYGSALFWVTGYTLLGTALAVVLRSTTAALAVGIGWAGPLEHITGDAWDPAMEAFPGLLLEQFIAGRNAEVSMTQASTTLLVYMIIAAVAAASTFRRRDAI